MFSRIMKILTGLVITILLASCGSGTQVAEGGIGGTGISTGTVTGFGSIIVNGVHFDTASALVIKDDDTPVTNINDADINQLISVGMTVTIEGEFNDDGISGTAYTITYKDILEGPIVGTPSGSSFNVLGQSVNVVTGVTQYSCDASYTPCNFSGFSDLAERQVVEISGFIDENGEIIAGYIELQSDGYFSTDVFEVKGIASVVDGTSFTIGGLTIVTVDTTGLNGEFVEAEGTFNSVSSTLTASDVGIEDESFDDSNFLYEGYKIELEGIVVSAGCSITIPCSITVRGVTVLVDVGTVLTGSAGPYSASDLVDGTKVKVDGILQSSILHASEIEFE